MRVHHPALRGAFFWVATAWALLALHTACRGGILTESSDAQGPMSTGAVGSGPASSVQATGSTATRNTFTPTTTTSAGTASAPATSGAFVGPPPPAGYAPGVWFTDNCTTASCWSCPGTVQAPSPGATLLLTPVGAVDAGDPYGLSIHGSPIDAGHLAWAACTTGTVGAGSYPYVAEGFNFATRPPDGSTGGGSVEPAPIDVSSYQGVQFWLYGDPSLGAQPLIVTFPDSATSPYGGQCAPICPSTTADMTACSPFEQQLSLQPGWQFVQMPFAILEQNPYVGMALPEYDAKHAYGVTFEEQTNEVDAAPAGFGYCVAELSFY